MKKYACLLLFAIILNGCDDGDLTAEIVDFTEITPVSCDDTNVLLYKLKDQESLLLQVPKFTFAPEEGVPEVTTIEYDIVTDGDFKLVYKAYDGVISKSNVCDAIRPSFPNVSNEWFATGGKVKIVSTAKMENDETNQSSKIVGFNYAIYMENITYSKPQGEQVGPDFFFGNFVDTKYTSPATKFVNLVGQCTTSKQLYNYTSTSSITIDDIDPELIKNEETINTPRRSEITATQNKIVLNTYKNGVIDTDYFCNTTTPTTPEIDQTWNAQLGGIIEVTTTSAGTTFTHTITLRNVVLENGTLNFKLGNNYSFGVLTTQL
jgi:hypothetical protein